MTLLAPVSREEPVRRLGALGFQGSFVGGRHHFMVRGDVRLVVPTPRRSEIGADLHSRVLRQAGVDREE